MSVLLFSALLLLLIFVIRYFVGSKRSGIKALVSFGVLIGSLALGINLIFDGSFGASTPINIHAKNLTNKNLKIYTIGFWSNSHNGRGNYVTFDKELKPNKVSDFWIESDGTDEFWVIAKNNKDQIEYLNIIKESDNQIDLQIRNSHNIDPEKAQIATELTSKTDKNEQLESFAILSNIILIGLLTLSLIRTPVLEKIRDY